LGWSCEKQATGRIRLLGEPGYCEKPTGRTRLLGESSYWEILTGRNPLLGDFLWGPQTSWEFELPRRFSPGTLNSQDLRFPGRRLKSFFF
jgi:hypothetical protein